MSRAATKRPTRTARPGPQLRISRGVNKDIDITPRDQRRHPWTMRADTPDFRIDFELAEPGAAAGEIFVCVDFKHPRGKNSGPELEAGVLTVSVLKNFARTLLGLADLAEREHPELNPPKGVRP